MRQILIMITMFIVGVGIGYATSWGYTLVQLLPMLVLAMIVLAGIEIGGEKSHLQQFKHHSLHVLYLPLLIALGSLAGGSLSVLLLPSLTLHEALLVSADMGYYSLSSSLISAHYSPYLGVTALLSGIMRESLTLLFAPLLVQRLGKVSVIAAGAATTMDSCLPIIRQTAGKDWTYPAFVSGLLLTVSVPLILSVLL